MGKIGSIAWAIGCVIFVQLILLIIVPFLAGITVETTATLNATSNMSNYPGTSGFILATPWLLYFTPVVGGVIAIIVILRQP